MRFLRLLAASLLFIVLILVGNGLVAGQYYGGPGGQISGFVYGLNGAGYDWAQINANNGNQTFHTFSGMSGFYLMRVPVGVYNISIYTPGLPLGASNANVTVIDGSATTVDFHLQQQPIVATPEFQTNMSALVMVIVFALAIGVAKKRLNARTNPGLSLVVL